ncbi:MAG: T9SS type A sorting domain-containing protein [Ignavibacteria bacterium]|nr:T9SS type A sorting domain-containing protein [Ignavibacteria bacterium]
MFTRILFFASILLSVVIKAQWYPQEVPDTSYKLRSVYFIDDQTGWAAGNNGIIIKTTDGGRRWTKQTDSSRISLRSLFFVDKQNGWAVGSEYGTGYSVALKTVNGGTNWKRLPIFSGPFQSVFFIDSLTGWITGGPVDRGAKGIITKTTDGGATWKSQSANAGHANFSVFFIDHQTGWLVGDEGIIFKTTNGGDIWVPQTSGVSDYLRTVRFINRQTGWIAGHNGIILKTTNGGETWINQSVDNKIWLDSFNPVDSKTAWAAGIDYGTGSGTILKTVDGGLSWYPQIHPSNLQTERLSVFFLDGNKGWAVGDGTILKTTNGGDIFTSSNRNYTLLQNYPNPFNPVTTIKYAIPPGLQNEKVAVRLVIYNMLGEEVALLVNEEKPFGTWEAKWDASGVSSGVYFYRLTAGGYVDTRKMVLVR